MGRVFTPLDAGELASIIVELAHGSDGIEEMSKRCRELSERFDLNRIAAHAEAVLTAVSEGRPLPAYRR